MLSFSDFHTGHNWSRYFMKFCAKDYMLNFLSQFCKLLNIIFDKFQKREFHLTSENLLSVHHICFFKFSIFDNYT
jgi:hypothetical protein